MRLRPFLAVSAAIFLIGGCGRQKAAQPPVPIGKGDVSVLCGMYVADQPGPRAEAYIAGAAQPLSFGSTRDLFALATSGEMSHRMQTMYVQDTARIDWQHPSNGAGTFIDARKAYYVAWQPLVGAMGPTLASFAERERAEEFIRREGGELLTFDEITPDLVSTLGYQCPAADRACMRKPSQRTAVRASSGG